MFMHRLRSFVNEACQQKQTLVWIKEIFILDKIEIDRVSSYYNVILKSSKKATQIDNRTKTDWNLDFRVNLKLYLIIFADTN